MEGLGHRMVAATGPAEYQNDGQGDAETGCDPAAGEDMGCHRVAAANQELEGTTTAGRVVD